ncbi:unnamed protein product, partial [Sphacelaria rigidula]
AGCSSHGVSDVRAGVDGEPHQRSHRLMVPPLEILSLIHLEVRRNKRSGFSGPFDRKSFKNPLSIRSLRQFERPFLEIVFVLASWVPDQLTTVLRWKMCVEILCQLVAHILSTYNEHVIDVDHNQNFDLLAVYQPEHTRVYQTLFETQTFQNSPQF